MALQTTASSSAQLLLNSTRSSSIARASCSVLAKTATAVAMATTITVATTITRVEMVRVAMTRRGNGINIII
ncbi:conserved hypothetical protein [Ricinus communis]|uniref:Uncharacterized protein n=1 Tax=Ricinus communis TaxID=3988 RepID=B9RWW2_RICCO|nr:conserved hypothetical protein [Ricinus communis]